MIHYEEKTTKPSLKKSHKLISLNKTCKFCPKCKLIIGQKPDIDPLIGNIITQANVKFNQDNYLVMGTMDKKIWLKGQKEPLNPAIILTQTSPFKDVLDFKIRPAGWYFDGK